MIPGVGNLLIKLLLSKDRSKKNNTFMGVAEFGTKLPQLFPSIDMLQPHMPVKNL